MPKLRLLLGDDHTLVRQGLLKILEERPEWQVVAEVGDGRTAVQEAIGEEPIDPATFPPKDSRLGMPRFQKEHFTRNLPLRDGLSACALASSKE